MMVRYSLISLFIVGLVVLPQVWAQEASEASDPPSFEAKYKLILERNIFSRARKVYREVVEVPRNEPPPPPLEASFVVVGISRQHDMTVAFIEDKSMGKVDQYAVNSQIARGKIQAMTLDLLQYVVNTDANDANELAATEVRVGQSLLGEAASGERSDRRRTDSRRPTGQNDESKPAQTSGAADISDADMDAVLKRMMEKRQSE